MNPALRIMTGVHLAAWKLWKKDRSWKRLKWWIIWKSVGLARLTIWSVLKIWQWRPANWPVSLCFINGDGKINSFRFGSCFWCSCVFISMHESKPFVNKKLTRLCLSHAYNVVYNVVYGNPTTKRWICLYLTLLSASTSCTWSIC